jgi:hypothetical protein
MLELVFDPILDVPLPVADIPPHAKTRRPFSPISPLVEGGYRHSEIVGKFFHGEQLIAGFHSLILKSHPFTRMSMDAADLSAALSATLQFHGQNRNEWL